MTIPIYIGFTQRDTKIDNALSVTLEYQRSQMQQWVDLEGDLKATRDIFQPQRISVAAPNM